MCMDCKLASHNNIIVSVVQTIIIHACLHNINDPPSFTTCHAEGKLNLLHQLCLRRDISIESLGHAGVLDLVSLF